MTHTSLPSVNTFCSCASWTICDSPRRAATYESASVKESIGPWKLTSSCSSERAVSKSPVVHALKKLVATDLESAVMVESPIRCWGGTVRRARAGRGPAAWNVWFGACLELLVADMAGGRGPLGAGHRPGAKPWP